MRILYPRGTSNKGHSDLDDVQLATHYAYPYRADGRPWLRANFISTLDGAAQGPDGRSGSLASSADRRVLALLRALADVILVGAGTARAEHYGPASVRKEHAPLRVALGLPPRPPIAVVSGSLDVPHELLTDPATIILTSRSAPAEQRAELAERVDVAVVGDDVVDPTQVLNALAERGHTNVITEGGPTLFTELAAAGLLDELCLTMAPTLLGGDAPRVTHGALLPDSLGFRLDLLLEEEGYLFSRWQRKTG